MKKTIWSFYFTVLIIATGVAQKEEKVLILDLNKAVTMANKESLAAFKAKNTYLSSYWRYKTFKANRLPTLTLNLTPIRYNRDFTKRYDSQNNIDVYRQQQSLYSFGNLSLVQNFDWLGGTFFVDSELGFFKNMGDKNYTQFTSVPIRIGYRQNLIGYNVFKWEKKIAPLQYSIAQKELLYNIEQTAEEVTQYFFNLAMAKEEYRLAKEKIKSSDTLYTIGKERFKIAGIRQSDLMTLRLDKINAENTLKNAEINLKRSMFALISYLNLDKNTKIELQLPKNITPITINASEALKYAKKNNPTFLRNKNNILNSKREVDRTKKESQFNLGFSASVGFNQVAENFQKAYHSPLQQDVFSITLSVPILDWGVRKGKYNIAQNNLKVVELTAKQNEIKLEEDILTTSGDFEVKQKMILSTKEALELAKEVYRQTQERFIIGKADINSITLSNDRYQQAQRNYIHALKNYWISYFKLRKLTLYDFEKQRPINISYDTIN